jgi:hypothetical protein
MVQLSLPIQWYQQEFAAKLALSCIAIEKIENDKNEFMKDNFQSDMQSSDKNQQFLADWEKFKGGFDPVKFEKMNHALEHFSVLPSYISSCKDGFYKDSAPSDTIKELIKNTNEYITQAAGVQNPTYNDHAIILQRVAYLGVNGKFSTDALNNFPDDSKEDIKKDFPYHDHTSTYGFNDQTAVKLFENYNAVSEQFTNDKQNRNYMENENIANAYGMINYQGRPTSKAREERIEFEKKHPIEYVPKYISTRELFSPFKKEEDYTEEDYLKLRNNRLDALEERFTDLIDNITAIRTNAPYEPLDGKIKLTLEKYYITRHFNENTDIKYNKIPVDNDEISNLLPDLFIAMKRPENRLTLLFNGDHDTRNSLLRNLSKDNDVTFYARDNYFVTYEKNNFGMTEDDEGSKEWFKKMLGYTYGDPQYQNVDWKYIESSANFKENCLSLLKNNKFMFFGEQEYFNTIKPQISTREGAVTMLLSLDARIDQLNNITINSKEEMEIDSVSVLEADDDASTPPYAKRSRYDERDQTLQR